VAWFPKRFLNSVTRKRSGRHCSRSLHHLECGLSLLSADYSSNPAQFRRPSSSGFLAFTPSNYVEMKQPYPFAQAHDITYRDMLPSRYIHYNIVAHLNAVYGVGYKVSGLQPCFLFVRLRF